MRRLLLVPVLALAVSAAPTAPAGAGDQRESAGGGVSVVLPAGWHRVRGRISYVMDPIPVPFSTFHVRYSTQSCECGTPNVRGFPRDGALVVVWEYRRISRRDLRSFPSHRPRFDIHRSSFRGGCSPSDGLSFREGDRGFQVEIYLGPAAPASARRGLDALLDSWRLA